MKSSLNSKRYTDYVTANLFQNLKALVNHLNQQSEVEKKSQIEKVKEDRKLHMSCTEMTNRNHVERPFYNNKTSKQGEMFDRQTRNVPYLFIPKYKNDTFIMPDRAFVKGKNAKRSNFGVKQCMFR